MATNLYKFCVRYVRELGGHTKRFNVRKKNGYLLVRLRCVFVYLRKRQWIRWQIALRRWEMDGRKCKKTTVPNGKRYYHNIHVRCYNCRKILVFSPRTVWVPREALLMVQKIAGRTVWSSTNMKATHKLFQFECESELSLPHLLHSRWAINFTRSVLCRRPAVGRMKILCERNSVPRAKHTETFKFKLDFQHSCKYYNEWHLCATHS